MSQKHTENRRKIEKMKRNTQNSRKTLKNCEKHTKFVNMHRVHTLDEKALNIIVKTK